MMMKKIGYAFNADMAAWGRVATILPFAIIPVYWQGALPSKAFFGSLPCVLECLSRWQAMPYLKPCMPHPLPW